MKNKEGGSGLSSSSRQPTAMPMTKLYNYGRLLLFVLSILFLGIGSANYGLAKESGGGHDGGSSHSSEKGHGGSQKGGKGGKGGAGHSGQKGHEKGHGGASKAVSGQVLSGKKGQGRPVWAKEGLPEVELGRLNVSRAPDHVLNKALAEARGTLAGNPQADIHSPLQNLALYYEAMTVPGRWTRAEAARFLGSASDKRVPITNETVEALNIILGIGETDSVTLARDADLIRQTILADHDAGGGDSSH